MPALPRAREFTARWRDAIRARTADDAALSAVLSWIRVIALEDDVVYLDTPRRLWSPLARFAPFAGPRLGRGGGYVRFVVPSLPSARPERVADTDARGRVRFVVRGHGSVALRGERAAEAPLPTAGGEAGWRSILNLRDLVVFERDAAHGTERPLRLGLNAEEGWCMLQQARRSAERFLDRAAQNAPSPRSANDRTRFAQRCAVAVAVWTRGRLRGSVIASPGPALRTVGLAAVSACQDARFPRLSAADLAETVFQVGLLHSPRIPLSRREIATCDAYPDKALFVWDGTRAGAYLPEAFNVFPRRMVRLQALAESVARDKAGLEALGPSARVEVCEVTEVIESADRGRAVRLDGPVARFDEGAVRAHVQAAGQAACAWLSAIQADDGSLPLFVRPSSGKGEGTDFVRSAMTAEALAAFGVAYDLESAVASARRVLDWLDRSRAEWMPKRVLALPTTVYRGNAAAHLGDDEALEGAAKSVLEQLGGPDPGPLVLAHAAAFLRRTGARHPAAARKSASLREDLAERFERATRVAPVSLAEWAELVAVFPADSETARGVCDWLRSWQLDSGAFPETTASDFVYSRGTGKVFEVLALRPTESPEAIDRALGWLLSMQYRRDSAFFVPHEHWPRVLGGLRHDYYGPDAWIDAAGHFLIGLARLRGR
jgi:AMMECR1 domain-containing protein